MKPNKKITSYLWRVLAIVVLIMSGQSLAQAHEPRYTHLATSAVIAEDPNHEWTADDVAAGKYDDQFRQITEPVANLDFTTSTWWVKLELNTENAAPKSYYIEAARPLTNVVNLYRIVHDEANLLYQAGDNIPFNDRPVVYRKFVFPITLKDEETHKLLFELESDGEVITLPIKLWDQVNFNGFIQRENLTLGVYYGLLIFVTGLFLFFAFLVRQRIYTYYVSYVVFLFLMQASLDGLAFEYLWPNSPWMANHSILFFSGASVFMIMLYAAEFLQLNGMPKWYQVTYRSLLGLVAICILTGLTSGTLYELTFPVINGMSLLSLIVIIAGIAWNQNNGRSVNIFFALGFLSVLAGGIVFILTNFNLIYSDFLSQNAIKLGSAAEVTFLSLAMVNRYRDIQREKEEARKEAYDNLEKLNKLTREQNIKLEQQVAERTADLREKSDELVEKNKEIIDSITYARRIQEAILPPDHLFHLHVPNAFVFYLPKDIVAGDFYWLDALENNTPVGDIQERGDFVLVAAADCTGHGVPGAMVSVVCHNALNRSVREFRRITPSEVLDQTALIVDETFEKSEQEVKDGMDISLLGMHKSTGEVQWAGANNPLWIISKEDRSETFGKASIEEHGYKLYEIKADKQPIGRYPNREAYKNHKFESKPGDTYYLFSDGYPDQFGGPNSKKYKTKNFKRFLLSIQDHPMDEQRHLIHYEFHHWRRRNEQLDDVCVIGVRVESESGAGDLGLGTRD